MANNGKGHVDVHVALFDGTVPRAVAGDCLLPIAQLPYASG